METDKGKQAVIDAVGTQRALADLLGCTSPAISGWKRVPAERVLEIEQKTGVPRSVIRPDIYPPDEYPADQFPGAVDTQPANIETLPVKAVAHG